LDMHRACIRWTPEPQGQRLVGLAWVI
jgi:hypothetical protein